jgi:hypothetical protein
MHQIQLEALGFPYPENASLLIEGGSKFHGAKLEGKDDTDWYGLYVEPAEIALGLDKLEHFVHTTGGKGGGNGPDVDLTLCGLRKFAGLACKGNPSVLHFSLRNRDLRVHCGTGWRNDGRCFSPAITSNRFSDMRIPN